MAVADARAEAAQQHSAALEIQRAYRRQAHVADLRAVIQRHTAQLSAAETKIEGLRDTAQRSESEVAELRTKLEQKTSGGANSVLRLFKEFQRQAFSADHQITLEEFKRCVKHVNLPLSGAHRAFACARIERTCVPLSGAVPSRRAGGGAPVPRPGHEAVWCNHAGRVPKLGAGAVWRAWRRHRRPRRGH